MSYYDSDRDPLGESVGPGVVASSGGGGGGGGGGGSDIIGALIALGTSIYNNYQHNKNVDKTIAANKAEAELAYQRQLEMWNMQNQYNSPIAQMERFRAAGLNPNMIYGSGGGSSGNSASFPKYDAPTLQYNHRPVFDVPTALSMYQDFAFKQAQIDNVKAQTDNIDARTVTEGFNSMLKRLMGDKVGLENRRTDTMWSYDIAAADLKNRQGEADLVKTLKSMQLMDQDVVIKGLEQEYRRKKMSQMDIESERMQSELLFNTYRNEWMKQGVVQGDNVILRVLTRWLNDNDIDMSWLQKRMDGGH